MRVRIGMAALAAAFAVSCVAWADDDRRSAKGFARAERRCEREAEDQGLRVEKVGDAERVGKKRYEVKLRVEDRSDQRRRKDDDFRVLCRYDDEERRARIY
jgi:mRNA-degrading endonuclease RelE of RelBE toxin-antitoxin system